MFARFKSHFSRQSVQKSAGPQPEVIHDSGGYFCPQSPDELLATPLHRQYLQQLWQNSALPEGLYQHFYLAPLKQLLGSVQHIPATPEEAWSGRGGFADLTLQFTACAVRLAKGHLLPLGAAPETQAAQGVLWQAVVFWAALFYHLPLLRQFEGELEDGHHWQPGLWTPGRRFRFRFRTSRTDPPVSQEAMIAARLLPETAVSWLFLVPEAWHCLTLLLSGQVSTVPLVDSLLQEAAEQVQSPLQTSAVCPEPPPTVTTPIVATVAPTDSDGIAPLPVSPAEPATCDDTQALLSLFQSNDEVSSLIDINGNDNAVKSGKRTGRKTKNVASAGSRSS